MSYILYDIYIVIIKYFFIHYFLKIFKNFPTLNVIVSEFLIALVLPKALPVIVRDAINAVVINTTKEVFKLNLVAIEVATSTPAEPDTTPQTSPTTSLQIDANLSEFFKSFTEWWDPFTFLDAIEWNGVSSWAVIATPIISNIIDIKINNKIIIIPKIIFIFGIKLSDVKDIIIDKQKESAQTVINHENIFSFFFISITYINYNIKNQISLVYFIKKIWLVWI